MNASQGVLTLQTFTDTVTNNGRTYTTTYSATTNTITTLSPQGRQQRTVLDNKGRPVQHQEADGLPLNFNYNSRGQLIGITQGTGTEMRALSWSYDSAGFLQSSTDSIGRTNSFTMTPPGDSLVKHSPMD